MRHGRQAHASSGARQVLRLLARTVAYGLAGLLVVIGLGLVWVRAEWRRSLPQVEGERRVAGLSAEVTVDRDTLGVPLITARTRQDAARALGFVHAQDRFFQMDLARRRAAGELAEIFGPIALPVDRSARLHRFRARAATVLAAASGAERDLVDAYAAGVNAGLQALASMPFEYRLLGAAAQPWRAEDCVLVVASMYFNLQDEDAEVEGRAAVLHAIFPAPLADFLESTRSEWDTPLDGAALPPPVPPAASVFDVRSTSPVRPAARRSPDASPVATEDPAFPWFAQSFAGGMEEDARGSNAWAVSGAVTADGAAILANDMHLSIGVPNTWYRAAVAWSDHEGPHRVTGVTLPGVPALTAGSNGRIAWGFTNTTADWIDRVLLDLEPGDPSRYRAPQGARAFDIARERIVVKGAADEVLEVRETIWGPVSGPDDQGRLYAIAWVAHHPEGLNLHLLGAETAATLDEALHVANLAGIPAQNFVVVDDRGQIAWTIAGRIPRRVGFDGRLPASWADGVRGWHGWYPPDASPRIVNPPDGRIVSANNRLVGGQGLQMLGDGGYDPGARARQIRDDLMRLDRPRVADMLKIQLDDRALLMERWRALALRALSAAAVEAHPARQEFRRLVTDTWNGRASVQSVAYRLVREFRTNVAELAFAPFVARARRLNPAFPRTPGRGLEGPVWALVTARPPHLLDPRYPDWDALLLDAIDQVIASLTVDGARLDARTWGEANASRIRHPLSRALGGLRWWLDMPRRQLPGDSHMPRVQGATLGASERLAVSPGREADGYFHMPGGQSGHPLSPHYRDGHEAWAKGEATPLLPGPPVSRLTLHP